MIAVMTRKAAPFWLGRELPPNVASLFKRYSHEPWQERTWDEIHAERRRRQMELLAYRRSGTRRAAIKVQVRYFDIEIYGGWHTYLHGIGFSIWLRGREGDSRLMKLFPQPQPSLFGDRWQNWMTWFASTYKRGMKDGHPRGVAYCWALCDGDGRHTRVRQILDVIHAEDR